MNRKKWARYLILSVLAIAIAGILLNGVTVAQPEDFNSESWKRAEGTHNDARLKMVSDLLRKHTLVGMRRSEIDRLLGKPNKTPYFSDYEYVYWLGPERAFISIDSEWLGLKFKNDAVAEASLLKD